MNCALLNFLRASLFCVILSLVPSRAPGAGVTIITHGQFGSIDDWVWNMAANIPAYPAFIGTNIVCYEIRVTDGGDYYYITPSKIAGGNPLSEFSSEIVVKLDWSDLAGFLEQYDTYTVASLVVPRLLNPNYIPELGGHALAEFPIHLVGHSRGGSLVCEMSKLLGQEGVWVDQVTTFDPHPANNSGNIDPLFVVDAPLHVYENVLFADNYYQDYGGYPDGQFMPEAFNRFLADLSGGYPSAHSDTHLWYHGTIDLRSPGWDGVRCKSHSRCSPTPPCESQL